MSLRLFSFLLWLQLIVLNICDSKSQSLLYTTNFGTQSAVSPAGWVFTGRNMNISTNSPSSGYPGFSAGAYLSEGNYKGFVNTLGESLGCSVIGNSSATLTVSTLGHTDIRLSFGMIKSSVRYSSYVSYSLQWSVDGINYSPIVFSEPPAGTWGLATGPGLVLPSSANNQPVVYFKWSFSRNATNGFFKIDDFKVIADDNCVPPVILSNPVSVNNVCAGIGSAVFQVAANGTGPFTYQWQANGLNIADGTIYSGTNSPVLTINAPSLSMQGNTYRCLVSNCSGIIVPSSGNATLGLKTILGDIDINGTVSNADFFYILSKWNTPCANCVEDLNLDMQVDILDFLVFIGEIDKICQ
jgi:hypothetical protein